MNDLHRQIAFTKEIAKEAGQMIRCDFLDEARFSRKDGRELVTETDVRVETHLRKRIGAEYPSHNILAEEQGGELNLNGYLWIIDPLDGTNNFAHRFPVFSTSIALALDGEVLFGVVYDPMRDELFHSDDRQAYLNDKPIKVTDYTNLSECILGTGFPYDGAEDNENNLDYFRYFCLKSQGMRRCGSAALDLAYIAAGRLDGFWELKLKPWDMSAGYKIVRMAGGACTDFDGNCWQINHDRIIAANEKIHKKMLTAILATNRRKNVNDTAKI